LHIVAGHDTHGLAVALLRRRLEAEKMKGEVHGVGNNGGIGTPGRGVERKGQREA
jgi:hypothetical protein